MTDTRISGLKRWIIQFEHYDPNTCRIIRHQVPRVKVVRSADEALHYQQSLEYTYGWAAHTVAPMVHKWKEVTEARFDETLGVVPPVAHTGDGFLIGEPWDHHPHWGFPRFAAMIKHHDRFYESLSPMGIAEWRGLIIDLDVLPNVVEYLS